MKKIIPLALCAAMLAGTLASCASDEGRLDPAITLTSSDAQAGAEWLDNRLDEIPDDVVIGIGSDAEYGIDMSDFESDGYILREMGGEVLIFGASADGLDRAVRKYAKAAEAGATAELDEVYHEGYRIEKLTVAGRDISEYTVYYPSENNESMLFGVSELQRLIKQACGAELAEFEGTPSGAAIEFRFLDDETVNDGGYKYRVENGNIIIEGIDDFGCPNAVYRLLQEECGWEGLCYGDSVLAEAEFVDIPEGTEYTGNPRFDYFRPTWRCDGLWLTDKIKPTAEQYSYGSISGTTYAGHVFHANHGMVTNDWAGHTNNYQQICYTDEENYGNVFDKVYSYIESKVEVGQTPGKEIKSVDISQSDCFGYCLCASCAKIYREEGNVHSAAVVRFANRLDDEMSEYFDGIKYLIFAYHGTNIPCKTAPNDDVYVTFCTDGHCSNHGLNSGECYAYSFDFAGELAKEGYNNFDYAEWIKGWCALSDNIYVWYYGLDGGLGSNNFSDNLYDDLVFMYESGVKGVYLDFSYKGYNMARTFNEVAYDINWDRNMTEEEYWDQLDRRLEAEYGSGWYYIRECMKYWAEGENRTGCWNCWGYLDQITEQNIEYCAANYDTVYEYAKKAIALADCELQEIYCVKFFAMMVYQCSTCSYFAAYDAEDNERLAVLEERWSEMRELYAKCGIDPDNLLDIVRNTKMYDLKDTCEEEAWKYWKSWRGDLTPEGTVRRPAPEKYTVKS